MIHWAFLLLIIPVSWFSFFLGVALCNSSWADKCLIDGGYCEEKQGTEQRRQL